MLSSNRNTFINSIRPCNRNINSARLTRISDARSLNSQNLHLRSDQKHSAIVCAIDDIEPSIQTLLAVGAFASVIPSSRWPSYAVDHKKLNQYCSCPTETE